MKKQIGRSLRILLVCAAVSMCFLAYTWAWPTVEVIGENQISLGMVEYTLRILQDEQALSESGVLAPGEYTLELTASGNAEGWFAVKLSPETEGAAPQIWRTEILTPGQSIAVRLNLAETAVLSVEGCWGAADPEMTVLSNDVTVFWGESPEETPEESEPTEPAESEAAETEPEVPESSEPAGENDAE